MARKLALGPMDVAMNFLNFKVTTGAASDSLVANEVPTGMSPRTGIGMLIHQIEYNFTPVELGDATFSCALSTRAGLAAVPTLDDDGCIDVWQRVTRLLLAEAAALMHTPIKHTFWPPVILATSKVVLYAGAATDIAAYRLQPVRVRLGFTTVEMTAEMYREVAETWGW